MCEIPRLLVVICNTHICTYNLLWIFTFSSFSFATKVRFDDDNECLQMTSGLVPALRPLFMTHTCVSAWYATDKSWHYIQYEYNGFLYRKLYALSHYYYFQCSLAFNKNYTFPAQLQHLLQYNRNVDN